MTPLRAVGILQIACSAMLLAACGGQSGTRDSPPTTALIPGRQGILPHR